MVLEALKKEDILKSHMKKLMPFVQHIKVWLSNTVDTLSHSNIHAFHLPPSLPPSFPPSPSLFSFLCTQASLAIKGAEALDLTLPFDEKVALQRNINYLTRSLDVSNIIYVQASGANSLSHFFDLISTRDVQYCLQGDSLP